MTAIRVFLLLSTLLIYAMTIIASVQYGINWPAVAINDLLAMNWRSQFDTDFVIYLLIVAFWISWREGFTFKGHVFAFTSVVMGGMFSFPYLLYISYRSGADARKMLLGVHV